MPSPQVVRCSLCPPGENEVYDDVLLAHAVESHPEAGVLHTHPGGYMSTLCLHDLCAAFPYRCRETCKYCGAYCECAHHADDKLIRVLAAVYREASATCESGLRAVLQELRDRGLLNEVTR